MFLQWPLPTKYKLPSFVNQLVYNTSIAMVTQECIHKEVEAKLHALEVVLLHLGESTNINIHMYTHKCMPVYT